VLIHRGAVVYVVTNEPCPKLWFAEQCLAGDFLDLSVRSRYEPAYEVFAAKAKELLDAGGLVCSADVCRALGHKPTWGARYWRRFLSQNRDALEGERKYKWKET
jgi:hypothetical protein